MVGVLRPEVRPEDDRRMTAPSNLTAADNPFLEETRSLGYDDSVKEWFRLIKKYSCAVPTDEALEALAERAPIVEVCAGSGYWAWMMRK